MSPCKACSICVGRGRKEEWTPKNHLQSAVPWRSATPFSPASCSGKVAEPPSCAFGVVRCNAPPPLAEARFPVRSASRLHFSEPTPHEADAVPGGSPACSSNDDAPRTLQNGRLAETDEKTATQKEHRSTHRKKWLNGVLLSGRRDSNPRPPAPKAGALTGLRYAPIQNVFALQKRCVLPKAVQK